MGYDMTFIFSNKKLNTENKKFAVFYNLFNQKPTVEKLKFKSSSLIKGKPFDNSERH
jgi:hypothetical protein